MIDLNPIIKLGAAKAFFAVAFADQAELCGCPLGGDIMDQLPERIDPAAWHAAATLMADLERANGHSPAVMFEGFQKALEIAPHMRGDRNLEPELFGHYLAMQAMGTGVGLESFGDLVHIGMKVPYVEFGSHSLELEYFTSSDEAFREAARRHYAEEGSIEIDKDAAVSRGDGGAYIQAWVWVSDSDSDAEG